MKEVLKFISMQLQRGANFWEIKYISHIGITNSLESALIR